MKGLYLIDSCVYCTGRPDLPSIPHLPLGCPALKSASHRHAYHGGKATPEKGQNLYYFLPAKISAIAIFLRTSFSGIIPLPVRLPCSNTPTQPIQQSQPCSQLGKCYFSVLFIRVFAQYKQSVIWRLQSTNFYTNSITVFRKHFWKQDFSKHCFEKLPCPCCGLFASVEIIQTQ